MLEARLILQEQFNNIRTIFRLAKYEEKATYQSHYLGMLWQVLNPLIQIGIYYLVFGLGVNGGRKISGVPFIVWMLIGIITWFFLNASILGASNSIHRQVILVSKMKFPLSILPTTNIVGNLNSYFPMLGIVIMILFAFGIYPTLYWLQFFYYFFAMIAFLFAFGILNATITTLIRDYHITLQSILRLLFYLSGAIWDVNNKNLPELFIEIIKINPLYYLIEGFRDAFLSRSWFWEKGTHGMIFWGITLSFLIIGSHLHLKFRKNFIDLI